jgi:hypothetical protein
MTNVELVVELDSSLLKVLTNLIMQCKSSLNNWSNHLIHVGLELSTIEVSLKEGLIDELK